MSWGLAMAKRRATKSRKKTTPSRVEKSHFLGMNILRKWTRWRRRGKGGKSKKGTDPISAGQMSFIAYLRIALQIGLLSLVVAIIGIILLPWFKVLSLETSPLAWDWEETIPEVTGEQLNILVLVYEESNGYSFVDFISLLSITKGEEKSDVIYINPELATSYNREIVEINKLPAKAAAIDESPYQALVERTESMLGVQVDRYLAFSKAGLLEIFNKLDITYDISEDVEDEDAGVFIEGQVLEGGQLFKYLAADQPGIDAKNQRLKSFIDTVLFQNQNMFFALKAYVNSENILKNISTNMQKNELFSVANHLWGLKELRSTEINLFDTLLFEVRNTKYYVPNTAIVDEKVQQLFALPEVQREQARIEVYNGAGVSGFAGKHRRWLSNLGGNVVRAANSPELTTETVVYNPSEGYPENIELIRWVTRGKVIVLNEVYPYNHTAELVLVLGSDLITDTADE